MADAPFIDGGLLRLSGLSVTGSARATVSGPRPRLALVGNAPLKKDHSSRIDSSDVVIRCNEAKTLGGYSGTRTDILCVTNTGEPARRIMAERSIRQEKFPNLAEVWFPRDSGTHLRYLAHSGLDYPESEFHDLSGCILEANGLNGLHIVQFSADANCRAFERLKKVARNRFICPSTGFLALWNILENPRYTSHDKYLFGFTFRYWEGHPADAERREIRNLCSARNDIRFVPVGTGFFPQLFRFTWRS